MSLQQYTRLINITDRSKAEELTPPKPPRHPVKRVLNEFLFAKKQDLSVEEDWDELTAPTAVHNTVGSIQIRHIST